MHSLADNMTERAALAIEAQKRRQRRYWFAILLIGVACLTGWGALILVGLPGTGLALVPLGCLLIIGAGSQLMILLISDDAELNWTGIREHDRSPD